MKRCALLTCSDLKDNILDEDCLEKALQKRGWEFDWINWKNQSVDWNDYTCAIVRTTWDYTENSTLFLEQLEKIAKSSCRLFNDLEVIRWNVDKSYLLDLAEKGVDLIPTQWLTLKTENQLKQACEELQVEKVVVKPQVGAGAKDTFLFGVNEADVYGPIVELLVGEKIMIQPFMSRVVEEGEFSAHFFNNQWSHTVLKTPKPDDFRSQEEFGSHVRTLDMTDEQMEFCKKVLAGVDQPCLFARVDFINDSLGRPCLNELELIEPSLYFRYEERAASRMVEALEAMFSP